MAKNASPPPEMKKLPVEWVDEFSSTLGSPLSAKEKTRLWHMFNQYGQDVITMVEERMYFDGLTLTRRRRKR